MNLLLIRHGQTLENIAHVCQGQSEGTLSPLGIAQAEALAEQLHDERLEYLYTSDLTRAVHTAELLFAQRDGLILRKDLRLRERSFGPYERKKLPDHLYFGDEFDGAESIASVLARAEDFLTMLRREHVSQQLAIVSHGITLRALISLITGRDFSDIPIPENCTPYRLSL